VKRRMGWQKPTDYAAEMAEREAREYSAASDARRSDPGTRGIDESIDEPDSQGLRGRFDLRPLLGVIVYSLFVVAAVFLAVGALLVAINADPDNGLVGFVLAGADAVDLGIFSREGGLMTFSGANAETQGALVNWGLGSVVWLAVGRVLDRLLRP
jgi:hypothetical protein